MSHRMVEWINENHFSNIMRNIWFCHKPIGGRPCGMCRPCQQKMECDMEWLLPREAQIRYKRYKMMTSLFGKRIGERLADIIMRKGQ